MNPSDKINMNEKQVFTFSETIRAVSPVIAEMIKTKDNGEITLHFHDGEFKKGFKKVTF